VVLPELVDGRWWGYLIASAGRELRRNPVLSFGLALGAGAFIAVAFRPRRGA
jgi:zinc transporter ZupT